VLRAGESVPALQLASLDIDEEALAYRAAVLGCAFGLEEVPGSIHSWAADDPSEPFDVGDVSIHVWSWPPGDLNGSLIASRAGAPATLEEVPDEIGFPVAKRTVDWLVEHGVVDALGYYVPESYLDAPVWPGREQALFTFHPRVDGLRMVLGPSLNVSLAADGEPLRVGIWDRHIDDAGEWTLFSGEPEATQLVYEVIERQAGHSHWTTEYDGTLYMSGEGTRGPSRFVLYEDYGNHNAGVLSLVDEDARAYVAGVERALNTWSWW
jgi:hypothetical protein